MSGDQLDLPGVCPSVWIVWNGGLDLTSGIRRVFLRPDFCAVRATGQRFLVRSLIQPRSQMAKPMRKQIHARGSGFRFSLQNSLRAGLRSVSRREPDWLVLMLLPVLFAVCFCLLLGLGFRVFPVAPVAFLILSVLGFLATIILCDGTSRQAWGNYPRLRTVICSGLGALISILIQSVLGMYPDAFWLFPGLLLGGILGWLGVGWTRYL